MPEPHIPCPACSGAIKVRKSSALFTEDRTGLLVRECVRECFFLHSPLPLLPMRLCVAL